MYYYDGTPCMNNVKPLAAGRGSICLMYQRSGRTWKKSTPSHPGKPQHPSGAPPFGQCPYVNNTFQKGASLCCSRFMQLLGSVVSRVGQNARSAIFLGSYCVISQIFTKRSVFYVSRQKRVLFNCFATKQHN